MDAIRANSAREYAVYLRKSVGRAGIARQRNTTTAHIDRSGGVIAAEFADVDRTAYRKPGAARPEREQFNLMLTYLADHPGTGVAAWHADRLLRDPSDTEDLIRACASGGHLIETPSGGSYDLSTATGRKRLRQDANDAAYEVDHGRERCLAEKTEAAMEGRDLGGRRRFGWDRVPAGRKNDKPINKLVLIAAEADLIEAGTRQIISGMSLAAVTRAWNASGITTSSGRAWKTTEVSRTLRRARNAGLLEHGGEIAGTGNWPPVVSEAQWRAVLAVLSDPGRRTSPGPERRWLCSGIALCGICGATMLATTAASKRGTRPVYRCRAGAGQIHVARDAVALDDWIGQVVVRIMSRRDAAPALEPRAPDLTLLHTELEAVRAQLDGLAAEVGAMTISARQLAIASAPLVAKRDLLEARLAAAARPAALAPFGGGRDPEAVWKGLDLARRRAVVTELMTVTVDPAPLGRRAGWKPGETYFHKESIGIEPKEQR